MRTKTKFNQKTFTILALLLLTSASIMAQDVSVKPLSEFLNDYKEKHNTISKEIEENQSISFSQKLTIYANKIGLLKEDFKTTRKKEYLSKSVTRAKRYSCKGVHVRKVTDCSNTYIKTPNENMYTQADWIELKGAIGETEIVSDSSSVGLNMKVAGKGEAKGTLYATFKYKQENIDAIVNQETTDLFNQLAKK